MSVRSRRLLFLTLLFSTLFLACRPGLSVRYLVTVSQEEPRQVRILADLDGVPRDSLVLRGFGGTNLLHVSELEALAAGGKRFQVRAGADTIDADNRPVAVPRYVILGPLPSRILVRYRVAAGTREGDSHMGFTGVRQGYVGSTFALVTGRSLFLLPSPSRSVSDIQVRFSLPAGWRAVTPWNRAGDTWRPGVDRRFADEHLIAATLGLGRFAERAVSIGRTRYRFAYECSRPGAFDSTAVRSLGDAARWIRARFARDLGQEYVTVIVPAAPDGDEIHGEGWARGQGGTLSPMTAGRLHEFALSLLGAYLRDAPYRDEIAKPEEYWIADGILTLYAWRAVASAGWVDGEEIERDLASSYGNARLVQGAEQDLERLYSTQQDSRLGREIEAPFVLAYLDRVIRERSSGRETLDGVVRAMFRSRPAGSFWASIPGSRPRDWDGFRARYVRGREGLPAARFFGMAPTRPLPSPPAGKPARWVSVIFTGDTFGFLEHCGCKVNQSGGVARRATVIERLRGAHPGALLLDAGNAFLRPEKDAALDFLSRKEQRLYLETMALMRYDAAAIGTTELMFGAGWFRDATRGTAIPYVSCNISEKGSLLAPPARVIRSGGVRVGVVSAFEPPHGPGTLAQFEANTAALTLSDPVASVVRAAADLRGRADLVVVIGRLDPATIRKLVKECPRIDLVISNVTESPVLLPADGPGPASHGDQGFLGRTLVLYEDSRNYGLESVELGLDADGYIATAGTTHHWLFEDVPDQPLVRRMLDRFYDRVGTLDSSQAGVRPLFSNSPARMEGVYVGARRCAPCHAPEYNQWKATAHATAYKTLLDAHRHYQPKCVVCHVVGFRTRTGYKLGDPEEPLANVQCEICHGPGGEHVLRPAAKNMERMPSEAICLECHNPEHSDAFVYAEKLPRVRHLGSVVSTR